MRRLVLCSIGLALLACSKADDQQQQQQPAAIALADVAGRWSVKAMAAGSDSALVTYELVATADTAGWTLYLQGREPIPVQVLAVAGDSIVTHSGPYASVLRPGVQVTVHSVARLRDGKLIGTSTASYSAAGADSVVSLRTEGTRVP